MSFVFVSHANPDKARIRHIVDALIADGQKVWLDNPAAMGYSKQQIAEHFHYLEAGGRWRDKIEAGLRSAGAVLVCWSERAKEDRKVWHAEASVARTLLKLIACRVDDVDPTSLPDSHGEEQIPDLRTDLPPPGGAGWLARRVGRPSAEVESQLALLVQAVRAKMSDTTSMRFDRRVESRATRDPFLPYLVDRTSHESTLGVAIEEVVSPGGVRAFVIAGPENECPDEFLERLRRHTSPHRLQGKSWFQVPVEWPFDVPPTDFSSDFNRRLAPQLQLPSSAPPQEIAKALAQRDRPVAVVSLMHAEEWRTAEPKRISAWLAFWQALIDTGTSFAAIPILCVKMPEAKPGWAQCPAGCGPGGTVSNAQIWRDVRRIATSGASSGMLSFMRRSPKALPIGAPPVLHPVTKAHAAHWLMDRGFDMMSREYIEAKAIIDRVFAGKAAARHGVALKDFAAAMRPMFWESR